MTLNTAFDKLKATAFPGYAESDDLADWISDLAEFDGYVAGIASTIIGGGRVSIDKLHRELDEMKIRLSAIDEFPEDDQLVYDSCTKYMQALEEVVLEIAKTSKGKG